MPELNEWDSFYVIVGSAAGALIGLQFVVMTLIAERPPPRFSDVSAAFGTPTVLHFGVVLLVSALVRAPWHGVAPLAWACGTIGVAGLLCVVRVAQRMRVHETYEPQLEDWIFHAVLPFVAYAVLAVAAWSAREHARMALFAIGGAALLLLFVGIHNAWDSVVFHVVRTRREQNGDDGKIDESAR